MSEPENEADDDDASLDERSRRQLALRGQGLVMAAHAKYAPEVARNIDEPRFNLGLLKTALSLAAYERWHDGIVFLLARWPAAAANAGRALEVAAEKGSAVSVKLLLDHGAHLGNDWSLDYSLGQALLHQRMSCADLLVAAGARLNELAAGALIRQAADGHCPTDALEWVVAHRPCMKPAAFARFVSRMAASDAASVTGVARRCRLTEGRAPELQCP